jgi:UDP-glucuronate 4-epimerase
MKILVTGIAGFIGFHTATNLLEQGMTVVGVDNINDYYDQNLKKARLNILRRYPNFIFYHLNIATAEMVELLAKNHQDIIYIIHLAAQAGVRYSIENPLAYTESNVTGHLHVLELSKKLPLLKHLIGASSSSVYGANKQLPFSTTDHINCPVSLYAASKISAEAMSYSYSYLFNIPITMLRFFTVYGPWGRPDMAVYLFANAILKQKPIQLFNKGNMKRDFTYIGDVVNCINLVLTNAPSTSNGHPPYKVYNVASGKMVALKEFITLLEQYLNQPAIIEEKEMQPGDMKETFADITDTIKELNFTPTISLEQGLKHYVEWFKLYYT